MVDLPLRLMRLRKTPVVRSMLQETRLHASQLIAPIFVSERIREKKEISSMPGYFQLTLQDLPEEVDTLRALGISAVILFGIPLHKDAVGSASLQEDGIVQQAIRVIRAHCPELLIIADVCLCEYTDHGHCGVLHDKAIHTEQTLMQIAQQAVSFAAAGADWVAPSGMIDGMVHAIRAALDGAGYHDIVLLSYSAKYSSCLYGPFRQAAEGAPQFGDRKTYQMNSANALEAIRESALDVEEGADMLMVKPAMLYLDVIYRVKQAFPEIPLCAYQVSGEYSIIKNAAEKGLVDEQAAIIESLLAIKRAGADLIISYFAKDMARLVSMM